MKSKTIRQIASILIAAFVQFVIIQPVTAKEGGPLPQVFIENKGQITDQYKHVRKDIDFVMSALGIKVFVGQGQLHYQWAKLVKSELPAGNGVNFYRLDAILEGANMNATPVAEETGEYYETYYLPQCPDGIVVRSSSRVVYKDIYPHIDWVIYTRDGNMKYDFVVRKGGNAADIKIRFEGATSITGEEGNLLITTPYGSISEKHPYTYDADSRQEIPSAFVLNGNRMSFDITGSRDNIVIDPVIGWSTYYGLGASSETKGTAVAADYLGNGYHMGFTNNTGTIATFGSHQYLYASGSSNDADGYIIKFNVSGTRAWATYYGGEAAEEINAATCDKDGNLYITGSTYSASGIASTNVHQPNNGGTGIGGGSTRDAFVVKFNPAGTRQWGTYYGGTFQDYATGIAVDKDFNVFITGVGASTNDTSLASSGAYQTTPAATFIAKFNPSGYRLWGTYYGGPGDNFANAIACDTTGDVYIGGNTVNQPQLATSGAHQSSYGGSTMDGFLAKFSSSGQRIWGTMYGGNGTDVIRAIACDRYNNVYIGGLTASTNAIATSGVYQPSNMGGLSDGFLVKFNATTGQRIWGTYYGGTRMDILNSIYAGPERKIYIGGTTNSANMATPGNYQTTYGGENISFTGSEGDGFLAKFSFDGKREWSTYYGGSWDELLVKMAYGGGKLYLSGMTSSHDTIGTSNGLQPTYSPPLTIPASCCPLPPFFGFMAQFEADTAVYFDEYTPDTLACPGDTLYIRYGVTNPFRAGNSFTLQLSNALGSFANPTNINTIATATGGSFKFWIPDTLTPAAGYRIRIVSTAFPDTTWDNGKDIRVSEYPQPKAIAQFPICANSSLVLVDAGSGPSSTTYKWTGPGAFNIGQRNYNRPNVQVTDSGFYVLTADNYSCITKDSVHVIIYNKPNKPIVKSNSPICLGDTLKVWATSSSTNITGWNWLKPAGYVEYSAADTIIPVSAFADSGWYKTVAVAGGCPSDMDSVRVVIENKVAPTVQVSMTPANPGPWVDVQFSVSGFSNGGSNPTYQWTKNNMDIPGATGNTYSTKTETDLQTGDEICVRMTSNANCAIPPSVVSCIQVNIEMGIGRMKENGVFHLYPNPNNGRLTLKGKTIAGEFLTMQVVNVAGQVVYEEQLKPEIGELDKELDVTHLSDGVYMLKVTDSQGLSVIKFIVNR